jgi:hypothetical protein
MSDRVGTQGGWPWALWGLSSALVALPFLVVRFPPATDLPQHLGQIHLLREVLAGRASELTISWWTPGNLVYVLLGAATLVAPPPLSGKLALLVLALAWVAAAFYLAARRGRPAAHAVLASVFVFNTSLYWGFLPFLAGWPVFTLWLVASLEPLTRRAWTRLVGLSVLLYAAHALWFLMGALWLALSCTLVGQRTVRQAAARVSPLAPLGIVAALWYPWLAATREGAHFDVSAHWLTTVAARLDLRYVLTTALGAVEGRLEAIVGLGVGAWVLAGVWAHRHDLGRQVDRALLACASMFWVVVLFAPDKYMNTIFFGARWLPCAVTCLVLAVPAPRLERRLKIMVTVGLVTLFATVNAGVWHAFERMELSGLDAALVTLPEGQRVLGLDFVKTSAWLRGRPFLQTFAYAQAMRRAALNFSFTEHASGIVRERTPSRRPWTPGLEWSAERVRAEDLAWFDYLLVNGVPAMHEIFASNRQVRPVTREGRWRLYQVVR